MSCTDEIIGKHKVVLEPARVDEVACREPAQPAVAVGGGG
jgi:hypothetical protein